MTISGRIRWLARPLCSLRVAVMGVEAEATRVDAETFFMASLFGASIPCEEYEDALFLEGLNGLNSEEE